LACVLAPVEPAGTLQAGLNHDGHLAIHYAAFTVAIRRADHLSGTVVSGMAS
jgi:hypothetical protein